MMHTFFAQEDRRLGAVFGRSFGRRPTLGAVRLCMVPDLLATQRHDAVAVCVGVVMAPITLERVTGSTITVMWTRLIPGGIASGSAIWKSAYGLQSGYLSQMV